MLIEKKQIISKGFDTYLIVIYVLLVIIGWFTIYSSSYDANDSFSLFNPDKAYSRQFIWILVSMALAVVLLLIDGRIYQNYAQYIYYACVLLIVSVLFFGTEISGAKAWIKIGSFSIQPIEFAKFATALMLAKFFCEGKTTSEKKNIWLFSFIIILVPAAIAILQKDTGSALVFFSFIILFYREGMNENVVLFGASLILVFVLTICLNELYTIAIITVGFIVAWIINRNQKKKIIRNILVYVLLIGFVFAVNFAYNSILQSHQRQRIDTILGQSIDPKGADFNLNQSKIAIGSGGFFGKGYLNGTQTKLNFVPEQSTDFIFCGIGEEWGFVGSLVIIALFMALIIRIIILSERHRNVFTRIYGYGVASIIFFHLLINIGMTIGLVPVIGIPLPYISYGGSSILGFTILLFVFIKLNDA